MRGAFADAGAGLRRRCGELVDAAPLAMLTLRITQWAPMRTLSPERDIALKHAVDVDLAVPPVGQGAAGRSGRVGQAHAGAHQRVGLLGLEGALQLSELHGVVDAQHLGLGVALMPSTGRPSATAMATMSVR